MNPGKKVQQKAKFLINKAFFKKRNTELKKAKKSNVDINGLYIIPQGITSIGEWAFYSFYQIKKIIIPSSVNLIDHHAFYGCTHLESLIIPSNVTSIGAEAFSWCSGLISINFLNSNLTSIGEKAFNSCIRLKSITIPGSVRSIERSAFYYCTNLKTVILPGSLQSINGRLFEDCPNLTHIIINSDDKAYQQYIIASLPAEHRNKVLTNDLVIKIRFLHEESLNKLLIYTQTNSLHGFFNQDSATKSPNVIFKKINQVALAEVKTLFNDIETWPTNEADFAKYKLEIMELVKYIKQAIKDGKQEQLDYTQQEHQQAKAGNF